MEIDEALKQYDKLKEFFESDKYRNWLAKRVETIIARHSWVDATYALGVSQHTLEAAMGRQGQFNISWHKMAALGRQLNDRSADEKVKGKYKKGL